MTICVDHCTRLNWSECSLTVLEVLCGFVVQSRPRRWKRFIVIMIGQVLHLIAVSRGLHPNLLISIFDMRLMGNHTLPRTVRILVGE